MSREVKIICQYCKLIKAFQHVSFNMLAWWIVALSSTNNEPRGVIGPKSIKKLLKCSAFTPPLSAASDCLRFRVDMTNFVSSTFVVDSAAIQFKHLDFRWVVNTGWLQPFHFYFVCIPVYGDRKTHFPCYLRFFLACYLPLLWMSRYKDRVYILPPTPSESTQVVAPTTSTTYNIVEIVELWFGTSFLFFGWW